VLRATSRALRKGTSSMILLTAWWMWKHRNAAVFNNTQPSVASLLDTIKAEAREWALLDTQSFWVELYDGVFALSRACKKIFFSINASKRKAFAFSRKKSLDLVVLRSVMAHHKTFY
jgi:hypothetical protein